MNRKRSILDTVQQDAADLQKRSAETTSCVWMSTLRPSAIWSAPSPLCRPLSQGGRPGFRR